jgi:hypothetical protein
MSNPHRSWVILRLRSYWTKGYRQSNPNPPIKIWRSTTFLLPPTVLRPAPQQSTTETIASVNAPASLRLKSKPTNATQRGRLHELDEGDLTWNSDAEKVVCGRGLSATEDLLRRAIPDGPERNPPRQSNVRDLWRLVKAPRPDLRSTLQPSLIPTAVALTTPQVGEAGPRGRGGKRPRLGFYPFLFLFSFLFSFFSKFKCSSQIHISILNFKSPISNIILMWIWILLFSILLFILLPII